MFAPRRHAVLLVVLGLCLACSALPWPTGRSRPVADRVANGLVDLRGIVHVHTRDSHDSPGNVGQVVEAARSAGVSWVALTEHTRPGLPAARGRVHGVTLIPGYELRGWGGSILAIGIETLPTKRKDPIALVRRIHEAGGLAFLGHLERVEIEPAEFALAGLDGIEIANLHANATQARRVELAARSLLLPTPWMLRALIPTPTDNLARWEAIPEAFSIVGAVDAHSKLRVLGPLGGTVDSYARVFRLLTTHVWARDASRDAILEALREGRSYVAFEGLRPVDEFQFERIGDYFALAAPEPARLSLVCDGVEAGAEEAAQAVIAIPPGAARCRAEAWRGRRLWIVTSYRRVGVAPSPASEARPEASEETETPF
jgi:hypothetical protein